MHAGRTVPTDNLSSFLACTLQILVTNAGEEEVFEAAMEVGAEDIQPYEGGDDASDGYKVGVAQWPSRATISMGSY